MRIPLIFSAAVGLTLTLLLCGCGQDYNGWGDEEGFGGSTKGFGDVKGYGSEEVGLCTYTGGCMPDEKSDDDTSTKAKKSGGGHPGDHSSGLDN